MRQVPLTVWVHSIQLSLHWCIGMAYLNKCKPPTPQIDVYCNIQNIVTSSHSLCTTLFFICIKIPERTKTFTPWGSVLSLGNLQPWPLHMLPGALFTTLTSLTFHSGLWGSFFLPGGLSPILLAFLPGVLLSQTLRLFSCFETQVLQWESRDTCLCCHKL